MSDASKMGLFGSKDDANKNKEDDNKMSKEDSPEHRYAPYSVDSNSEAYDTEALSIMDINDIIGVQTEPVGDSTLEGEMAELSAMITETNNTKAGSEDESSIETKVSTTNENQMNNINPQPSVTDSQLDSSKDENKAQNPEKGDNDETGGSNIEKNTTMNQSLQLIGEAYDSEDSQEDDVEEQETDASALEKQNDVEATENIIESVPSEPSNENHVISDEKSLEQDGKVGQLVETKVTEELVEEIQQESSCDENPPTNEQHEAVESVILPEPIDPVKSPSPIVPSDTEPLETVETLASPSEPSLSTEREQSPDRVHLESMETEEAVEVEAPAQCTDEPTSQQEEECPVVAEVETSSLENEKIELPEEVSPITEQLLPERPDETTSEKNEDDNDKKTEFSDTKMETSTLKEDTVDNVATSSIQDIIHLDKTNSNPDEIDVPKEIDESVIIDSSRENASVTLQADNEELAEKHDDDETEVSNEKSEISDRPCLSNQEQVIENALDVELNPETTNEEKEEKVVDEPTSADITEENVENIQECAKSLPTEVTCDVDDNTAVEDSEMTVVESVEEQPALDATVEEAEKSEAICKTSKLEEEKEIPSIEESSDLVEKSVELEEVASKEEIPMENEILSDQEPTHGFDEPEIDSNQDETVMKNEDEIMENLADAMENDDLKQDIEFSAGNLAELPNALVETPAESIEDPESEFLPQSDEPIETLGKNEDYSVDNSNTDSLGGLLDLDLGMSNLGEEAALDKNVNDEALIEETPVESSSNINEDEELFTDVIEGLRSGQAEDTRSKASSPIDNTTDIVKDSDEEESNKKMDETEAMDVSTDCFERSFNLDKQEKDIPDELLDGLPSDVDVIQLSELESAVKFLQESEEQAIKSPLALSPKVVDDTEAAEVSVDEPSPQQTFESKNDTEVCELAAEIDTIVSDSIAISEAEIINEAAKLESEKKLNEEAKAAAHQQQLDDIKSKSTCPPAEETEESKEDKDEEKFNRDEESKKEQPPNVERATCVLPKTSLLEERLGEPPKIEIPIIESRVYQETQPTKTSLLIQRDVRMNYQKMMESPKSRGEEPTKIADTSRREHEKSDIENVGSPRIILKIAKAAIADCSEPRSPKSPKIRSAANSPNPEDSPGQKLGKIRMKLSGRGGHPSIISNENVDEPRQNTDSCQSSAALSPLGVKIKLSKCGDATIVQSPDTSPLGMKIKLSKLGGMDASIIQQESKDIQKLKSDVQHSPKRTESPIGMKFKLSKSGDASIIQSDKGPEVELKEQKIKDNYMRDESPEGSRRIDSPLGMKIKLSKTGDASIISPAIEDDVAIQPRTDSPMGMKMKISKKSGASIVDCSQTDNKDKLEPPELPRRMDSPLGMKIKLSKSGDASIIHSEEDINQLRDPSPLRISEGSALSPLGLGMKIKLSKSGDASIVHQHEDELSELRRTDHSIGMKIKLSKSGDASIIQPSPSIEAGPSQKMSFDSSTIESMKIKLSKTGHPTIVPSDIPSHSSKQQSGVEVIEEESNISDVTLEATKRLPALDFSLKRHSPGSSGSPIELKRTKLETRMSQILPEVSFESVAATGSKGQYNDQESTSTSGISKQQINVINNEISITQLNTPSNNNFNDNIVCGKETSNDVEIIDDNPELIIVNENSNSSQDVMIIDELPSLKIPPEVRTPKRRGRPPRKLGLPAPEPLYPQDPLALDVEPSGTAEPKEHERPERTCSRQKSYAPPKRGGRGRGGRGKRKLDRGEYMKSKRTRIDKDLSIIECQTTSSLINLDNEIPGSSSNLQTSIEASLLAGGKSDKNHDKDGKDSIFGAPDRENWLTPSARKNSDISTIQVIDEDTRMSAESCSRSQTPARTLIATHSGETVVNEESQGSVLSTATTESEKVKVKNRRMEIHLDPDEGPFTVEKIAEYEWPLDRKGETFMIQEQISQYLGVKSFKRKYPDLKRRMVEMEERNHLRENGLVSESMCDMGLTAVYSSEVLDMMCSDFPDQYEEYRKHLRDKQIKEHSKKQKELTAAANAEKNGIDLAEMAVQSALSWNVNFNKARKETRRCSLDLQTFTIHVPKKQQKVEENSKVSHYPVALIPGQYTDYYREYTPAELRYYPLNTVVYGPMRPNERKFDSQSEGSQSDSDSDSSSDDSSSSSSEGTQDTEESQSTMDDVDLELSNQKDKSLKCKMCLKHLNKNNKIEVLIQCGTCNGYVHPSCIDLTLDMVPHIQAYAWQCTDCKTCAQCHDPADEDKMLFCDMCDRGYHIYCVGLRRVPQGRWHCQECAICASCGSREAGGINADRNSVAQWQHEYKKGDKNTRVYVSTLCVPCSKLCGEQGSDNRQEKLSV